MGQPGLFDLDERYAALSKRGDPLERLAAVVDFEMFRADLEAALARSDRSRGGRPPMDAVMMFQVLVLQALYGLADEQTEFQIRDRLSFMRFLRLDLHGRVPDARTIWLFRELLTRAKAIDALFARFEAHLRASGYLAMGGQMIDASIVEAPRQRNTDAEKEELKAGRIPEDWAARPAKLRQKDRDGRWTLKRGRRKRQPGRHADDGDRDAGLRLQEPYRHRPPSPADPHMVRHRRVAVRWPRAAGLLDKANTGASVWADTAYRSAKNERRIAAAGLVSRVHFRKPRGKPMPEPRARANAARSRERAGVEHVFADQKHRMGLFIRTIGIARARTKIGLANIACNLRHYVFLETKTAAGA